MTTPDIEAVKDRLIAIELGRIETFDLIQETARLALAAITALQARAEQAEKRSDMLDDCNARQFGIIATLRAAIAESLRRRDAMVNDGAHYGLAEIIEPLRNLDQPEPEGKAGDTERLGEALCGLSARLLLTGWLEDDANHAAYEQVVAAFGKPFIATQPEPEDALVAAIREAWPAAAERFGDTVVRETADRLRKALASRGLVRGEGV